MMKKTLLLLSIVFLWVQTNTAQEVEVKTNQPGISIKYSENGDDDDDDDFDLEINLGKDRTKKNVHTRFVLFDLGFDTYTTKETYFLPNGGPDPFEISVGKSTNVNIHLIQQRVNLIKHKVNLAYGIYFAFHKYYYTNKIVQLPDQQQVTFEYHPEENWKKNRLSYSFINVPLMLNFETNPSRHWRSFHINAGVYAGVRLGANFKIKENGGSKTKVRDQYQLNNFRFGLRGEFGYGPFNVYVTYSLTDLYDKDKNNGYILTPIQFGFILIPF